MIASKPTPSGSWSFVVTALAELGRTEIERRQRAAEIRASTPVRLQIKLMTGVILQTR